MFEVVESGTAFYQDFFGCPFPYEKYDQVFVPEDNFGASQSIGCLTTGTIEGNESEYVHTNSPPTSPITFNEHFIFTKDTSLAKRLRFCVSTLHELCHVWFGNLVTIKWWTHIGLDESFATYMSFLAMSKSPRLAHFHASCWVTFLEYKFWGVSRDSLSSTHPICCHVEDTCKAEVLYDGIAYGKGPAFVKQLFYLMGDDAMKAGLQLYF